MKRKAAAMLGRVASSLPWGRAGQGAMWVQGRPLTLLFAFACIGVAQPSSDQMVACQRLKTAYERALRDLRSASTSVSLNFFGPNSENPKFTLEVRGIGVNQTANLRVMADRELLIELKRVGCRTVIFLNSSSKASWIFEVGKLTA